MSEQTDKDLDAIEEEVPAPTGDLPVEASEFDAAGDPEPDLDEEAPADGPVVPPEPEEPREG